LSARTPRKYRRKDVQPMIPHQSLDLCPAPLGSYRPLLCRCC
jgi:hypothetical protein